MQYLLAALKKGQIGGVEKAAVMNAHIGGLLSLHGLKAKRSCRPNLCLKRNDTHKKSLSFRSL